MSLTERLKAAQAARQAEAARSAPTRTSEGDEPVLDLRTPSSPAVDLTGLPPLEDPAGLESGIVYDPVRSGDASLSFGSGTPLVADRETRQPCPRCGGATQVDLVDQVHQMVSLSCGTCFHMFRVPL